MIQAIKVKERGYRTLSGLLLFKTMTEQVVKKGGREASTFMNFVNNQRTPSLRALNRMVQGVAISY